MKNPSLAASAFAVLFSLLGASAQATSERWLMYADKTETKAAPKVALTYTNDDGQASEFTAAEAEKDSYGILEAKVAEIRRDYERRKAIDKNLAIRWGDERWGKLDGITAYLRSKRAPMPDHNMTDPQALATAVAAAQAANKPLDKKIQLLDKLRYELAEPMIGSGRGL